MNVSTAYPTLVMACSMIACAPFTSMPAPEHYSIERQSEIGLVGGGGAEINLHQLGVSDAYIFEQGYFSYRLNKKHMLGLKVQHLPNVFNGGVFYRYAIKNDEKSYQGIDVDLGIYYLKTSYMMAWRQDHSQFYFSPSVMLHPYGDEIVSPTIMLPLGYTMWVDERFTVNIEGGTGVFQDPQTSFFDGYFSGAAYLSLGLSSRF